MVPHSPTDLSPDRREILDAQLRESYGRVVYSHKTHEKEAELLLTRLSKIRIAQIALSALSTGGFITTLVGTGWWGSLLGAVCSAMLLVVNLYTKNHDLGKLAQQHRDAAIAVLAYPRTILVPNHRLSYWNRITIRYAAQEGHPG